MHPGLPPLSRAPVYSNGVTSGPAEIDPVLRAPLPQSRLLGVVREIVPPFEDAPPRQQILISVVSTPSAEDVANFVVVVGQELTSETQDQRLAEIELSLIRNRNIFLVADIVGQFLVVVAELGVPIDLARLPVEIGFILAHAAAAHEFEGELEVRKVDRHSATSRDLVDNVESAPPCQWNRAEHRPHCLHHDRPEMFWTGLIRGPVGSSCASVVDKPGFAFFALDSKSCL